MLHCGARKLDISVLGLVLAALHLAIAPAAAQEVSARLYLNGLTIGERAGNATVSVSTMVRIRNDSARPIYFSKDLSHHGLGSYVVYHARIVGKPRILCKLQVPIDPPSPAFDAATMQWLDPGQTITAFETTKLHWYVPGAHTMAFEYSFGASTGEPWPIEESGFLRGPVVSNTIEFDVPNVGLPISEPIYVPASTSR